MIKEKNIVVSIILTIVTCGIYGIVWFIQLTDDVATVSEDNSLSGGMAFLLTLVTCGIYGYYWAYKMGKTITIAQEKKGLRVNDNSILYLVLQFFGLGIVNYCIMQSDLNQMAEPSN